MQYWLWWHGKTVDPAQLKTTSAGLPVGGKIVDVEYIGNAMRGDVLLTFENGTRYLISHSDTKIYRPRKTDLILSEAG